jgi:hypothetical protein
MGSHCLVSIDAHDGQFRIRFRLLCALSFALYRLDRLRSTLRATSNLVAVRVPRGSTVHSPVNTPFFSQPTSFIIHAWTDI